MIWAWSIRRLEVWLRSLARSAERIAESQEELVAIARREFSLAHPSRRPIKHAEFGIADVEEDWNKKYRESQLTEESD